MTPAPRALSEIEAERIAWTKDLVTKMAVRNASRLNGGVPSRIDEAMMLEAYRLALQELLEVGRILSFEGPRIDGGMVTYECTFPR